MDMFVKRSDKFNVEVYVWEDADGEIQATQDKSQVPDRVEEVETVKFVFRRPNYQDSNSIAHSAKIKRAIDGETDADIIEFQDTVLRTLLIDWDLKDKEGQSVPTRIVHINNLQPAIARAAVAGCLQKISIF